MKTLTIEPFRSARHGTVLDFTISGKPLLRELERRDIDLLPRTSTGLVAIDQRTRAHLLREEDDDLGEGRVALYTCPQCGDYGCGVVSVRIEHDDGHFTWSDFRHETDYSDDFDPLERLGPFKFEVQPYRNAIAGATP